MISDNNLKGIKEFTFVFSFISFLYVVFYIVGGA